MVYINRNDQIVEFDVDNTLILWNHPDSASEYKGLKCKIHDEHVRKIKEFYARGHYVIIWTDGGWQWAQDVCEWLNIMPFVSEIRSKSKWHFDDKPQSEWITQRCFIELK